MISLQTKTFDCDIFCDVIDNYGDAGICWRLAKDLTRKKGWKIRLFINKLETLSFLVHDVDPRQKAQICEDIYIAQWDTSLTATPSGVVIETFGCRIPFEFEKAISESPLKPVWINLEYLSAEDWVENCNCLPSIHPSLGYTKYYFFPGVTKKTGGVIIEDGLSEAQDAFRKGSFLQGLGADADAGFTLFVFCYPNAPLELLQEALAKDNRPVQLLLANGVPAEKFRGPSIQKVALPSVEQKDFDKLLWASDSLIVRGEDSFVRAQLAAKPFIWNIYPQTEETHLKKLRAFGNRLSSVIDSETFELWMKINLAWNTADPGFVALWPLWRNRTFSLTKSALQWRIYLQSIESLTANLCNFIEEKIQSRS